MDEKTMVNDVLGSVKADLTAYQTAKYSIKTNTSTNTK